MFEKFTEEAIQAIMLAQEESRRLGHNFVGSEQILLGLIGERKGSAGKVLKSIGLTLKDLRIEVEKIIGRSSGFVSNDIPFTPKAKKIFNFSLNEAKELGHNYVGTGHLLLGITREEQSFALRILENLNINLEELKGKIFENIEIENDYVIDKDYLIDDFSKVIELDPNNEEAYFNRGRIKGKLEDYQGAIDDFSKLIELDSKNENAYFYRGHSKYYLEDYQGAIEDYSKVIELNSKNEVAYIHRGLLKKELKDYKSAIEDYTKAIELDPKNENAYLYRGSIKGDSGDYKGAFDDFSKIIELNPKDKDAYFERGIANELLENYEDAINDYSRVIELDQQDWGAYKKRGIAKRELKNFEGAIDDFSKVIELNLENKREFLYLRVYTKELSKNYLGAIEDYSKLIEIDQHNYDAYKKRGIAKRELKNFEGAIDDFTEAIESNPYNIDLLFNRGELYYEDLKDYKNALLDFTRILELNPHFGKVYLLRGLSYYELNQFSKSLCDLKESIKYNPTYEVFYDEELFEELVKEEKYQKASKGISNEGEYLSNKERKELFKQINKFKYKKSRDKKDYSEFKKEMISNNNFKVKSLKDANDKQSFIDKKFKSSILGVSESGNYLSKEERINLFKQYRDNAKKTEIISDLKSTGIYSFSKNELINKQNISVANKTNNKSKYSYSGQTNSAQKKSNQTKAQNIKSFFEKGYSYYQAKSYEKAIREFSNEININPTNEKAYFYRSYAKFELKDFLGSDEDYAKAMNLNNKGLKNEFKNNNSKNTKSFFDRHLLTPILITSSIIIFLKLLELVD